MFILKTLDVILACKYKTYRQYFNFRDAPSCICVERLGRKLEEIGFVLEELRNAGGKREMKPSNIWIN
jgi:hypothetical protein